MGDNISRKHHYLSQFYLKGFTDGRKRNSKLSVIDIRNKSYFKCHTNNVGSIRDFNRLDLVGVDPEFLEKEYSEFESKVKIAFTNIEKNLEINVEDFGLITNYMSFLYTRNPIGRDMINNEISKVFANILKVKKLSITDIKKFFPNLPDELNPKILDYALDKIKDNRIGYNWNRELKIQIELDLQEKILQSFTNRHWRVFKVDKTSGPLIISDHPVSLSWINISIFNTLSSNIPRIDDQDTIIYFPISQSTGVIGVYEKNFIENSKLKIDVDYLNSLQIFKSNHQIYSPSINFKYLDNKEVIRDGNYMINKMKKL